MRSAADFGATQGHLACIHFSLGKGERNSEKAEEKTLERLHKWHIPDTEK